MEERESKFFQQILIQFHRESDIIGISIIISRELV